VNAERRAPEGDTASDGFSGLRSMVRETCPECGRRPAAIGWNHCTPCLREFVAGLKRRNAAELRMPPLEVAS
jgi:hypothetical protein